MRQDGDNSLINHTNKFCADACTGHVGMVLFVVQFVLTVYMLGFCSFGTH